MECDVASESELGVIAAVSLAISRKLFFSMLPFDKCFQMKFYEDNEL